MRTFGVLLICVGALLALVAFMMGTTVSSFDGSGTYNLGLLQQQMMTLQTGLAAFIAGSVFFAASVFTELSPGRAAAVQGSSKSQPESDDEREERLAGVRRLNRLIGFALFGALGVLVLVIIIGSRS